MSGQGSAIRLRPLLWSVAAILLFFVIGRSPVRFASEGLNRAFGTTLLLALPWAFTVSLFQVGRWWASIPAALLTLALGIFTPMSLLGGLFIAGAAYDPIQEVEWQGSKIRVYRENAGAMSSWTIDIRQERTLLPGVLYVRPITSVYRCHSVAIEPTDRGIRVTDHSKGCAGPPIGLEIPLK